ncbi:hypothetical protein K3M67_05955 [Sphingobium sp. V4]|uniref:DUF7065 domain-containing protein n=1 Tax=Sphingobium sp. V4 TaxID=3038927 RepID=UPI002557E997|nr:hypothetical protein [Sphingobium sp. V4]WIW89504.1 hypothetical protein K3M67_05955 [Sphingobium sp. V4]
MSRTLTFPDGTPITNYSFEDEHTHEPGPEENWQESVAMWWWDPVSQCTGFMRIGHEPVLEDGNMTLWSFIRTPSWASQHMEQFPKQPGCITPDAMIAGGGKGTYRYDGKNTYWGVDLPDASLELKLDPLHQPIGLWPVIHAEYAKNIGAKHFELADRVEGVLTLKGERFEIKGYAYRDHSWGPRNWGNLKVHRWTNGLIGEDFGFGFSNYMVEGAEINKRGFIREGNIMHYTRQVDILPLMECDGATHRGGVVQATLTDGRTFRFDLTPTGRGFMGGKRGSSCQDTLCRVANGTQTGFGILEVSENPRGGTGWFKTLVNAYSENGIYPQP